jgi:chemotaxis protein methyltransferase CheR
MNSADDLMFARLARRISERSGLSLGSYKDKCLRRRIAVRMRACGVHSYEEYLGLLERTPAELERLVDVLTINVTKFFRNPEVWKRLGESVVPALLQQRPGRIRVWSAGCASGEEPYTLAMVFADAARRLGHDEWFERVTIDATDIDRVSLERTREARYAPASFSEAPPEMVATWCVREGDGGFRVADRVRQRLVVQRHDLMVEPAPEPPYELIVCRNVIIYFDRASQERLMQLFHDALAPRGFLLLGKVETIFGPARSRLEIVDARERLYQRAA